MNPDRPNIKYIKTERPSSSNTQDHLDENLTPMAEQLIKEKHQYQLTIMYTDTHVISYAYAFFEKKMVDLQYVGDAVPENRLFAQYHQTYTEKNETTHSQRDMQRKFEDQTHICNCSPWNVTKCTKYQNCYSLQATNFHRKVLSGNWPGRKGWITKYGSYVL
ncbi:hypothetical protein DPMN_011001 [Dreissena polymorpha]|uniref:Uncharacterized protein n=1 Tax=Dreissena polymorpha TaxID=45954 RepID=A0A9D4N324_DREPO|nr:hypothetical protein DPMN_011001 [Dreissena polymorpha]